MQRRTGENPITLGERVTSAVAMSLLYPLLLPTPFFWIVFVASWFFGFWTDYFWVGISLGAFGVPLGFIIGFLVAPEEHRLESRSHLNTNLSEADTAHDQ